MGKRLYYPTKLPKFLIQPYQRLKKILKSYLKRLTNLSAGNKSLLQLKLFKGQDLDLKELEFLLTDQTDFDIIEKLLSSTSALKIAQVMDSRNKYNNESSRILNAIFRRDLTIFNERGVHDLYIGWPFVQGQMIDGTTVRCPLAFISVSLEQQNNFWYLKRRKESPISLNRSFLLAYSYFNKISFSDDFMETNLQDFGSDSKEFRNQLYQFLKNSKLEINFNRELFEDKIIGFIPYKRKELEDITATGELKLQPQAVLGIYPQSGSYLVPDYEKLIEQCDDETTLEDFFSKKDSDEFEAHAGHQLYNRLRFINKVKEENTFTPFKYDASQENALKAVKMGKSIVVQGPPGTGKSQLISNLVADFISRRKKVLVVCQKKVALEVIGQRLSEKKLDKFTVLLHDFNNDRKAIFDQLADQIDKVEEYQNLNNRLDTIYLDRHFLQASREIDNIQAELDEFKFALFDNTECGISVKELYLKSNPKKEKLDLRNYYGKYNAQNTDSFLKKIERIYPYKTKLGNHHNPFRHRLDFSELSSLDQQNIQAQLTEIAAYRRQFKNEISAYLTNPIDIKEASWVLDREEKIGEVLRLLANTKSFEYFKKLHRKHPDENWLTVKEKLIDDCFKDGFEKSLESKDLGKFRELLDICSDAQKHFWKRWVLKVFNRDAVLIRQTFQANDIRWDKKGLEELTRLLDNRLNFQHHITELTEKEWLIEVPLSKNKEVFDRWFGSYFEALQAFSICEELRSFKEYWNLPNLAYQDLKEKLLDVMQICKKASEKYTEWSQYFSKTQLDHLLKDEQSVTPYQEMIEQHFDDMCAYDRIKKELDEGEKELVSKLFDFKEGASLEEVKFNFQNSIYLHWIDHIETKYPILRDVSSMEMDNREHKIREAVKAKRKYATEIVLEKVRENTYRDLETNRLGNTTTYRDLHHQVTKKRRLWPVRKVIQEFQDEVFDLIPCWLASPEAVSAVFPLEHQFDLVIFDEASQCYAEKSIPAIYRAKQVVITGDAQQLSPYDLYQVRYEDEAEEDQNTVLEIDSLLDVGSKYLMEVALTGHYRSKSVDLIQFSNQHFYQGKLRMIPHHDDFVKNEKGFEYIQVNGTWNQSVNEIEADEVTKICLAHFETNSPKSIGVVTFNFKQQQLILDKILDAAKDSNLGIPESFFVKNIENVQGDERDLIIFSLAYAPNQQGKFQMNFGSLNQKGGPNRLNVAVTRAKEKNIVVASIMPHEMQVDDAKNEGPRLLKAFLEYAYQIHSGTYQMQYPYEESSNLKWLLKHKIASQIEEKHNGYKLQLNHHFADIVSTKDQENDLFLTDDDLYFRSQGVKDSHVYTPLSLRQKEWSFTQKYSRNHWLNQEIRLPHKYQVDKKQQS